MLLAVAARSQAAVRAAQISQCQPYSTPHLRQVGAEAQDLPVVHLQTSGTQLGSMVVPRCTLQQAAAAVQQKRMHYTSTCRQPTHATHLRQAARDLDWRRSLRLGRLRRGRGRRRRRRLCVGCMPPCGACGGVARCRALLCMRNEGSDRRRRPRGVSSRPSRHLWPPQRRAAPVDQLPEQSGAVGLQRPRPQAQQPCCPPSTVVSAAWGLHASRKDDQAALNRLLSSFPSLGGRQLAACCRWAPARRRRYGNHLLAPIVAY